MKEWFARFNPREQLSLLALGLALVLYALYMLLWSPLHSLRDDMAARNHSAAESLQRVEAMVSEVLRLRADEQPGRQRNLTSLINQSTSRLKLQVTRLQPNRRGEIQVRMESVPFDGVLAWLHQMEFGEGLLVREVAITGAGSSGRVNVTVRIAQAR